MQQNNEDIHLEEEHDLIKRTVYVRNSKKQRSSNAERVARHRKKKQDQGLVPVDIPLEIAADIKSEGSFQTWYDKRKISIERLEKINLALNIARKINKLPWPINLLIFKILG